jgi:hypothetical protein
LFARILRKQGNQGIGDFLSAALRTEVFSVSFASTVSW